MTLEDRFRDGNTHSMLIRQFAHRAHRFCTCNRQPLVDRIHGGFLRTEATEMKRLTQNCGRSTLPLPPSHALEREERMTTISATTAMSPMSMASLLFPSSSSSSSLDPVLTPRPLTYSLRLRFSPIHVHNLINK